MQPSKLNESGVSRGRSDMILDQPEEQQIMMQPSEPAATSHDAKKNVLPAETTESVYVDKKLSVPEEKEEGHSMKLSIDVRSVKGLPYAANLEVAYSLPLPGTQRFQSKSPVAVPKAQEGMLPNSFACHKFRATKSELYNQLSTGTLNIELYDRHDALSVLLGTGRVPLGELLGSKAAIERTQRSVVRVFDTEVPVLSESVPSEPQKEMGKLRCILYLEDLGSEPEKKPQPAVVSVACTKSEKFADTDHPVDMWKRAEEAKFKAELKEREQRALESQANEWRAGEEARAKEFEAIMAALHGTEGHLRLQGRELQKREQKVATVEEEMKQKILEVTKQLASKEEEIIAVKTKCKDEKTGTDKDRKQLSGQIDSCCKLVLEAEEKYKALKKEYEESPVNQLKQEINAKSIQLIEIEKRLEKSIQVKETYRAQYEKIKAELIRLRGSVETEKERSLQKQRDELGRLRLQVTSQRMAEEEQKEMRLIKTQLDTLQQQFAGEQSPRKEESQAQNVFLQNYQQEARPVLLPPVPKGELARLQTEKRDLLESGLYTENDEVVRVLNEQIAEAVRRQEEP